MKQDKDKDFPYPKLRFILALSDPPYSRNQITPRAQKRSASLFLDLTPPLPMTSAVGQPIRFHL